MNERIEINHIAFVWQSKGERYDQAIRENVLDKLDERIAICDIADYKDSWFFHRWKIDSRYIGDLSLQMQFPILVIMHDGRPNIFKYYSELRRDLKSGADLTIMADNINKKVLKMIDQYGYKPSLLDLENESGS